MARPSKPVQLLLNEARGHRTKAELIHRAEAEQALYTGVVFREHKQVRENEIAHKEFLRLRKLYKHITYVDGLDEQIINRYCLEVAAAHQLQENLARLHGDIDAAEDIEQRLTLYDAVNKTIAAMNKSKELLLKYEDRLFLNPTARIKAIPKQPPKEEEKSGMAAFISKRAGAG